MKKFLINYYAIFILLLFVIYNIIFENLKIGGLLYQIIMIIVLILNVVILIKFRKEIKCKSLVAIIYFLIALFSKNIMQCLFDFSNIIVLMIIGINNNKFDRFVSILIIIFILVFHIPFLFTFILVFDLNEENGMNDIYEDTHYYCEDNYEVYAYSAGAMDKFHYSIGKYYELLNIDDIIYISYSKRNEKTETEYLEYIENHNCSLVEDKNSSK